jgi:hypothetical protein
MSDLRLLRSIEKLLADGLVTQTEPIPEDDVAQSAILAELRQLAPDDVKGKLVVGGFIDHPLNGDASLCCMTCMYFLTNRRWCDLPELALPVRPGWWCRLWRI